MRGLSALRRPLSWLLLGAALLGARSAIAENLSGADLVRELSDNTLTGFNGSLWFSEYHASDGRVFGHNASVQNEDACWKVRGDAICYYYPRERGKPQSERVEYCWHLERAGADGYKITPVGRNMSGIVRREAGNPRNHSDNGRAWTCDALISRLAPERPFSLAARQLHRP